jgi:hypothetical protein
VRKITVGVLILLGAVLLVPGSLQIWQERVLLNEDKFVSTIDEVFDDETVQNVLARRLTDEIMERRGLEAQVGEALGNLQTSAEPDSAVDLQLLTIPVSRALEEAVFQLVLVALQAQPLQEVRDQALRLVHRTTIALIENDREYLNAEGDAVVLDIGGIAADVLNQLGLEELEEELASIDTGEAGQITLLEESEFPRIWSLARTMKDISPWVALASLIAFALAIVVSSGRRSTTMVVGAAIVLVAVATMVIVAEPLREFTTNALSEPEGKDGAEAAYDILVKDYKQQQAFVVLLGAVMIAGGALAKEVGGKRETVVGGEAVPQGGFVGWVRAREQLLRFVILGMGATALVVWPEPSARSVTTVLVLAALSLVALTIVASESERATRIRAYIANAWQHVFERQDLGPATGLTAFVATRAAWFRAGGVLAGVIALVAWPSFSLGVFILVIALVLLYLAAIDLAVNSARQPDTYPD